MDRRDRSRPVEPDVYWRRRLFALAGGLAVLGVLAWAVGGATTHQAAATASLNSPAPQPGGASPTAFAAGSPPSPSALSTSPSASPSPSASSGSPGTSPSPSPSASSPHAGAGAHARHATATAAARKHSTGSGCPAADVVITLTENSNSYAPGARPQFGVNVVSTDSRTCTLNTGTRYLSVVVRSGGVRVWDSADCAGRAGTSAVTKLARGVPLQRHITWDRLLSSPGCKLARTAARPGTYTVSVSDGGSHSRTLAFVLR